METKFTPTHIMHQTGRVDVPVIINQKRDALWLMQCGQTLETDGHNQNETL